jgi:hypothetical protein
LVHAAAFPRHNAADFRDELLCVEGQIYEAIHEEIGHSHHFKRFRRLREEICEFTYASCQSVEASSVLFSRKAKITFLTSVTNAHSNLGRNKEVLKFKIEICLLLTSIVLFTISAFLFSYAAANTDLLSLITYPYRNYALSFVGSGGALMAVASVSYSKRSKTRL